MAETITEADEKEKKEKADSWLKKVGKLIHVVIKFISDRWFDFCRFASGPLRYDSDILSTLAYGKPWKGRQSVIFG